jgi:hypothetical protein
LEGRGKIFRVEGMAFDELVLVVLAVIALVVPRQLLNFARYSFGSMVRIVIATGHRSRLTKAELNNTLTTFIVVTSSTCRQFGIKPLLSQLIYAVMLF